MPEGVHAAQAEALEQGAQQTGGQGRQHQRGPKAHPARDRISEVGPQHVEAGVREIEHPHHAEDQREA